MKKKKMKSEEDEILVIRLVIAVVKDLKEFRSAASEIFPFLISIFSRWPYKDIRCGEDDFCCGLRETDLSSSLVVLNAKAFDNRRYLNSLEWICVRGTSEARSIRTFIFICTERVYWG